MGSICCCLSEGSNENERSNVNQPSYEERRELQAQAVERRMQLDNNRGIANPASVKAKQEKLKRLEAFDANQDSNLRWNVG